MTLPLKKKLGDTRELILKSALRLFSHKGYFSTSIHDIVSDSNISIGSIYHHFKDKQGVALALYRSTTEQMEDVVREVCEVTPSTRHRCYLLTRRLFDVSVSNPDLMNYVLYAKHREFLPNETPVCSSRPFQMMREMVLQGIEAGEIRDMDPMVASVTLFGGAIRLITAHLDGVLEQPLSAYLDEVTDSAWRAVAP